MKAVNQNGEGFWYLQEKLSVMNMVKGEMLPGETESNFSGSVMLSS
jgi:hypothetical protein